MKSNPVITWLTVLGLVFTGGVFCVLHAGECPMGTEYYIRILEENIHSGPTHELYEAFSCLVCTGDLKGNRWAGPTTRDIFNKCKNSPFRQRIISACLPYLELPEGTNDPKDLRFHALLVLSYCGVDKIDDYDVFHGITLAKPPNDYWFRQKFMAMAALGDPRTVDFIASTYDSVRTLGAEEHTEDLITLLNCLYHIPGKEAVDLAKAIKSNETVDILVRRADRVVQRK